MPAGIPREYGKLVEIQGIDELLKSATVFMAAMQKDDRFVAGSCRWPSPIEKLHSVPASEVFLGRLTACFGLAVKCDCHIDPIRVAQTLEAAEKG